jgi:hypothetical protein
MRRSFMSKNEIVEKSFTEVGVTFIARTKQYGDHMPDDDEFIADKGRRVPYLVKQPDGKLLFRFETADSGGYDCMSYTYIFNSTEDLLKWLQSPIAERGSEF